MKWSDVRKLYPNQFVKLKTLSSHIKEGQEIIDDMAVISPIPMNCNQRIIKVKRGRISLSYNP